MLVRCVVQLAINQGVVAVSGVVALIAVAHRTGKPVMSLSKKASRMQGFLSENHRDIVIKTQRENIEEHAASLDAHTQLL